MDNDFRTCSGNRGLGRKESTRFRKENGISCEIIDIPAHTNTHTHTHTHIHEHKHTALSKLRNFGGGGGFNPPKPPPVPPGFGPKFIKN
jgi:hypothetical protein